QTETTTDEVEIQEAAPLDPEGGNQGEPPVSEEVHDQEEHHDQEEEVEDQNQNLEEQTETTTDEVEIQEAAPLDPEGGNQGEPPVSEEVHDQEEHHDQEEEVEDQNQNLE
ncbi:hypothetical protein HID58_094068, partial [Brassica napus]